MNSVIIVAGGEGKRFSDGIPKQFYKIFDNDIIDYAISKFSSHKNIDEVIIVSHINWVDYLKERHPQCIIVKGGETRSMSVFKGLSAISNNSKNVLIHDAARPAVNNRIIDDCLTALKSHDCVAPIINLKDSIVKIINNKPEFINRDTVKILQTPQGFKTNFIKVLCDGLSNSSDEIGLALKGKCNFSVKFIKGNNNNIKITTREDIDLAKSILKEEDIET